LAFRSAFTTFTPFFAEMGFLTVIFFIVVGVYLLRLLFRWWIGKKIRQFQQRMAGNAAQGSAHGSSRRTPREGEIRVETGAAPEKKVNNRVGDYVEFEEVEITETTVEENQ
jgi:Sec-independent protein translocase protein TatA